MEYENPTESKLIIEENTNGTTYIIKPEKKWFVILFMCFWLCGWAVGEILVIFQLLNPFIGSPNGESMPLFGQLFMMAWLGGWTVGGFFALKSVFWQIAGKEKITISHESISILVDQIIFSRKKSYLRSHIKDLRLRPGDNTPFKQFNIGMPGAGKLAFDYGAKTINFGVMSEDAEAKAVIQDIRNKYPYYLENKPAW